MSKKEKLPPGWLKRESKTYPGNFYYFHKETKKTTWQFPTNEDITKTESKQSTCSNVGTSKSPAKTQRKSLDVKEKQESMIPRAVRQICTSSPSVRRQKRILNVSVLNRNNCNLVANYSSSSDGEEEESKSKKKKNENEKKTKKTNVILPSLTERKKVQMKWKPVGPSISQPSSKLVPRGEENATKSKDIVSSPIPKKDIKKDTKKDTKSPKKTVKPKKSTSKLKKKISPPSELPSESQESKPLKKKSSKKVSPQNDKPKKTVKKSLKNQEMTNEKSLKTKPSVAKKVVKKTGRKIKNTNNSADENKDVDQNKQNNAFPQGPVIPSEQFPPVVTEINASNLIPIFGENNTSFNNQSLSTPFSPFHFSDNYLQQIEDFSQPMEVDSCPDTDMIDYIVKLRRDMSNERFNTATGDLTKNFEMDTSSSINVMPTQPQLTYVVLDTNVLVNSGDLVLLKNICDGKYTADGHLPNIVIPWVVMQELDVLKSRSKQKPKTAERAQKAIVFLSSYFTRKHPRVIGQTLKEAMQVNNYLVAENNDDKILQCCMQFESKHPQCKIVLYSNDVNLCNKTMINGIAAFNKNAICSGLSKMTGSSIEDCDEKNECDNDKSPPPTKLTPPQLTLATQIFTRLKDILKGVLGLVLETEMKAAFGDVWLKIIKVQPPWELNDILYCYVEHWYAVFGQIYTNRNLMENTYKKLSKCFFSNKGFKRKLDFLSSQMDECSLVLEPLLSKNPAYKDEVKSSMESIEIFQQICTAIKDEKVDANSNLDELLQQQQTGAQEEQTESCFSTEFSMSIALTKFQEVWDIFNSYCQEVERTLQSGASTETCQQVLANLQTSIPMMEIIYKQFLGCLELSVADILQEINMFTVLAQQLNTILPHDSATLVNCGHLQTLFSNPEKREMLSNGRAQLERMIRGLHTYQGHLMGT